MPNFRDPQFLLDHIRHTMAFYRPRAIDPQGGFFRFFRDDGSAIEAPLNLTAIRSPTQYE